MPNKLPEGKVQVNTLISQDLYKKVLEYSIKVYGKTHGSVSKLVEAALREYIAKLEGSSKVY
jgi:hypothetical protein